MKEADKRKSLSAVVSGNNPVDTLGSPAIPHLRITHQGYIRLKDRKILTVEV